MSETAQPALEPVPVTKDTPPAPAVNGNGDLGDIADLPPPEPELTNGLNKPDMDSTGIANGVDSEINGESHASAPVPVNGDMNGSVEAPPAGGESVDLLGLGDDELPPPPAVAPELPPPPPMLDNSDLLMSPNDEYEDDGSSVDPVGYTSSDAPAPAPAPDSSVDPREGDYIYPVGDACVDNPPEVEEEEAKSQDQVLESSVDPDVVDDQTMDQEDDLMNVSDSEEATEAGGAAAALLTEPAKVVDDVSEEELVSDGGLKEEMEVELQNNQANEQSEKGAAAGDGGQLVDLSEEDKVQAPPAVAEPESVPEPVVSEPATPEPVVVEPVIPAAENPIESSVDPEPEVVAAPEPIESSVDPEPEAAPAIVEPEPVLAPVQASEPVMQTPEPVSEPEAPGAGTPSQEVEVVEAQTPESTEQQPASPQAQVGYAEPDIIVDNKPVDGDAVETPPPPPPPLVAETPPPPPPSLDDNIPLRRVSGGSSPSKESEHSIETVSSPVSVAVVPPQPEAAKEDRPVSMEPTQPASPVKTEPEPVSVQQTPQPAVPATQPIAVVAPQVQGDAELSPQTSPPASPTAVSVEGGETQQAATTPQVSQKINKKNFKNKIKFTVDLVEASLKQLHFLKVVNNNSGLYEEWLFKKAIRRYEAFWLPLAAEHKKESLAAPLDIEWLWHCHMLAPVAYDTDCKNMVGLTIEHKIMSDKDRTKSLEKSRKYWAAKYPKEPFEIDLVYKEKVVVEEVAEAKPEETQAEPADKPETDQPKTESTEEKPTEPSTDESPAPATEGEVTTEQSGETTQPPTEAAVEPTPAPATPAPETPAPAAPAQPEVPEIPEEGYEQRSSYNIFKAITRQRVFFYQTSLPHFHDKHFLKNAQKRYQRFLFVKHQNPTEVLVPCYDIDVMWHSHQLHPSAYKHDTMKVLGQILVHDDSINDRAPGSTLNRADQKTRDLWKDHFGDNLMTFGAMFRGEPPVLCERMSVIDPAETFAFSTKKATINLDKFQVEGLPEEVKKYCVKLAYGANEREGPLIKQFKGNQKKIEFENAKKGLAHFIFDTKEYDRIKFEMSQQIGFACAGHDEEIGQQIFNLMPVVESIPKDKLDASTLNDTVTIDIDEEHNLKANFSATIDPPKQGPTMLFMCPGNYETRFCIMPEQVVQMWGPIPLPRLPSGRDNHCVVASHKFANHTGEITFTCRIIHSLALLQSAVQVFYQGRMTAVAHLVGSDQIPLPSQLSDSKKIFSLNPADGQRAVLIKNQQGDWGLIRGQWTGFRKHQPAVAATKGKKPKKEVAWNPGTLSLSFYKCDSSAWQHHVLPYQQENYKLAIQDANVDLKTGTLEVNSESNEVAENLALSFSVALLHVICQPRYTPPPPPEPIPVTVEPPPTAPKPTVTEAPAAEAPASEPTSPATEAKSEEAKPEEGEKKEEATEGTEAQQGATTGEGEGQAEATGAEATPAEPTPAQTPAPVPEEKPQATPAKTPKSPTKSEPQTPSKKVKEIPPIPTFDLQLVIAAGYNIDTPTNENIRKEYGANACAGCAAPGMDVGIGTIGEVATETTTEVDALEAAEGGGETGDGTNDIEYADANDGMDDMADGGADMDMGGDMGDAGAAACGAF